MITIDSEAIRLITLFENLTGASVKDCIIEGDTVYFLMEEGMMGRAIGKNGRNVKRVERMIGKNIKLFEFSEDIKTFTKRVIPYAIQIDVNKDCVEVKVNKVYRPVVIGRDGRNVEILRKIFKRNFGVDIKIR